jgi:hypothetical protein
MSMQPDPQSGDEHVPDTDNEGELRRYAERRDAKARDAEERATAAEERVKELEAKEQRAEVQKVAQAKGLSDEQFESLLELNPNPTPEAIEKFAAAFVTNQLPKVDDNQQEDLMPGTSPDTPTPTGAPRPISGDLPPAKAFSTEDFAAAARRGDEGALRQMAEAVVRDPTRLKLKHPEMQPVGNDL